MVEKIDREILLDQRIPSDQQHELRGLILALAKPCELLGTPKDMNATAQLEMVNANAKKGMYWAISSQAPWGHGEGSTTSVWSPERTVKRHECRACKKRSDVVISPSDLIQGDIAMLDCKDDDGIKEWLSDSYNKHGLIGLVLVKGFRGGYVELTEELASMGVELGINKLGCRGLALHIEEIFSMACDGKTSTEIAEKLGAKTKTVTKFCNNHGIFLEQPLVLRDIHDILVSMVEKGMSTTEMSDEVGFTANSIGKYCKANGLVVKDKYHTGVVITHGGYKQVYTPGHVDADKAGYVREHRLVMSEKIGRALVKGEVVHHVNGDKLDNRLENLELTTLSEHASEHARNGDTGWAYWHNSKKI